MQSDCNETKHASPSYICCKSVVCLHTCFERHEIPLKHLKQVTIISWSIMSLYSSKHVASTTSPREALFQNSVFKNL